MSGSTSTGLGSGCGDEPRTAAGELACGRFSGEPPPSSRRRRGAHRRDDRAERGRLDRANLGDHLGGLALRAVKEAREHLGAVLRGDHLGELGKAREAEPPVPEGLDDLREPLDEFRARLPVEGGALREAEVAVQEGEEARVAELDVKAAAVEVREGDEEVGHCVVLAAEQVREVGGEVACDRHAGEHPTRFSALAWRTRSPRDATARWGGRERALSPTALSGGRATQREGHPRAMPPLQAEIGEFDVNDFR